MIRQLILAVLVVGLFTSAASAATTYSFEYTIDGADVTSGLGPIMVNGSITLDTLGAVSTANATDWTVTFSSGTYPGPTVLTPLNSTVAIEGAVTATATELQLLLSDPGDNDGDEGRIRFADALADVLVNIGVQTGEGSPNLLFSEHTPSFPPPFDTTRDRGSRDLGGPGAFVFATASNESNPIPEPASACLLGLAALGLLPRTRRHA